MTNKEEWLPDIQFDTKCGTLSLSGRSLPEDPRTVYLSLLHQVEIYCLRPAAKTDIVLNFELINTSSIKWLFNILTHFDKLHSDSHPVTIRFICSDENLVNTAKYLAAHLSIPIQIERT